MLHAHLNNVGRNRHFSSEKLQTVLISKLEIWRRKILKGKLVFRQPPQAPEPLPALSAAAIEIFFKWDAQPERRLCGVNTSTCRHWEMIR